MEVGILIHMTTDVYEDIAKMGRLGFTNGQLAIWDMSIYEEDKVKEIQRACADYHFTITAVWCGWTGPVVWTYPQMYSTLGLVPRAWRAQRVDEILRGAEFARKLGVEHIVTHLGFLPDDPYHPDHIGVVDAVRYICKQIEPYGQRFLFETGEELPISLVQLMREVGADNMGVNFDPANLMINGRYNPQDALDMLGPYIYGCHGKDGVFPEGMNPKGKEVLIGEGKANFPLIIEKLIKLGYNGTITIEREIPYGEQRDREIVKEKAYLEEIIRKQVS